jgi:hypothetical protein
MFRMFVAEILVHVQGRPHDGRRNQGMNECH